MFYSHARAMSNIFYLSTASLIDHESAGKGAEDFLSRYVDVWMLNDLETGVDFTIVRKSVLNRQSAGLTFGFKPCFWEGLRLLCHRNRRGTDRRDGRKGSWYAISSTQPRILNVAVGSEAALLKETHGVHPVPRFVRPGEPNTKSITNGAQLLDRDFNTSSCAGPANKGASEFPLSLSP